MKKKEKSAYVDLESHEIRADNTLYFTTNRQTYVMDQEALQACRPETVDGGAASSFPVNVLVYIWDNNSNHHHQFHNNNGNMISSFYLAYARCNVEHIHDYYLLLHSHIDTIIHAGIRALILVFSITLFDTFTQGYGKDLFKSLEHPECSLHQQALEELWRRTPCS